MASADINNIVQTLQSNLITIINSNSTSLTFTSPDGTTISRSLSNFKVVDGLPVELLRGAGMPTIIVHTPEETTMRHTQELYKSLLEVEMEIFDKREGNVRIIADGIRNAIFNSTNLGTLRDLNYIVIPFGESIKSVIRQEFIPNSENLRVWRMSVTYPFRWIGD